MTATLLLTGGSESIDFISGSEMRLLRDNALDLPPPEPVRLTSGGAPLTEGQALVERRFNNRQITLGFKGLGATHDLQQAAIAKLQRILNYAVAAQKSGGMLAPATLELKLANQTTSVTFTILDGDISLASPLNPLLRTQSVYMDNTLVLYALPYATGTSVRLENYLINPSFDVNPRESGRDGGYKIQFGTSGNRFEYATSEEFVPLARATMATGWWVYPDASSTNEEQIIAQAGSAWKLTWNPSTSLFTFTVGALALPSPVAFDKETWHFVAGGIIENTGSFEERLAYLMVDGRLYQYEIITTGPLATSTGKFTIGAAAGDTFHLDGSLCGGFVVKKNVWPWQIRLLYQYGLRSLTNGRTADLATGTPPGSDYWDLDTSEAAGVWMFDEASSSLTDSGGGGRNLTLVGTPTRTVNIRKPRGWTMSSGFNSSTTDGLVQTAKHGRFGCQLSGTVSTETISQVITIPAWKKGSDRDWTLTLYAKALASSNNQFKVVIDGDVTSSLVSQTVTGVSHTAWTQYGRTFTPGATDATLTITISGGSGTFGCIIDSVMLTPSNAFGLVNGTMVATPSTCPFVTSRFCVGTEPTYGSDMGKTRRIVVYDLPGDEPLASRVYVQNPV